jgi:N-acetyl-anhydromuramyl-L-alanine amidase AmpD
LIKRYPLTTKEDVMARKKIDPKKKRIPRHIVRANEEEWDKIKSKSKSSKSMNNFMVKELTK